LELSALSGIASWASLRKSLPPPQKIEKWKNFNKIEKLKNFNKIEKLKNGKIELPFFNS
jgi:hypothetical protein